MSKTTDSIASNEATTLADHPALDILNTVSRIDGELVDSLQSDRDVLGWLARAGWPVENNLTNLRSSLLLQSTRTLREAIRTAVEKRKAEKMADATVLNAFLAKAESHLELVPERGGYLRLKRQWKRLTPQQMLAPLAESAADLLATGDFSLIKRCENKECVLWFCDRTRSHHRRWCSMTTCGNRHKVAAFRSRQQHNS
jgi:predicted RNA-binding Zn ribbon-like protein